MGVRGAKPLDFKHLRGSKPIFSYRILKNIESFMTCYTLYFVEKYKNYAAGAGFEHTLTDT